MVPSIRGRHLDALVMFMVSIIAAYFTYVTGSFIFGVILAFFYNKYVTEQMLKEGYYPIDEISAFLLKQHDIYFKNRD